MQRKPLLCHGESRTLMPISKIPLYRYTIELATTSFINGIHAVLVEIWCILFSQKVASLSSQYLKNHESYYHALTIVQCAFSRAFQRYIVHHTLSTFINPLLLTPFPSIPSYLHLGPSDQLATLEVYSRHILQSILRTWHAAVVYTFPVIANNYVHAHWMFPLYLSNRIISEHAGFCSLLVYYSTTYVPICSFQKCVDLSA